MDRVFMVVKGIRADGSKFTEEQQYINYAAAECAALAKLTCLTPRGEFTNGASCSSIDVVTCSETGVEDIFNISELEE